MPKCQNCGAEFGGAEKFCSVCGQSTAAEQTVQPPPKVKKKSEKKIIIPVMCVLLLAVVGVGGWFGYNALFGDKTRGFDSGNAPEEGTSDAEFIKMLDTVRDYGQQLADAGFTYQCNYYFSLAGAGASSFRFAVENILWLKGEGGDLAEFTADSQYSDWESIARLNFASPYPYYFEGLVFQVQDKTDEALNPLAFATVMDLFPEEGINFMYLRNLDVKTLYTLRDRLRELEEKIYASYRPERLALPRDEYSFMDLQMRELARESVDAGDYETAYDYAKMGLLTNPFDVMNYRNCALCALLCDDGASLAGYVDEGLLLYPGDETLIELRDAVLALADSGMEGGIDG